MVNMKSWGSGVSLVCKEYQQFYVEPTPITPLRGPTCPFYCFLVRLCAGLCHLVRLYAIFCGLMPSSAGLCHLVPSCVLLCRHISSCAILCHLVPPCAILCHLVPLLGVAPPRLLLGLLARISSLLALCRPLCRKEIGPVVARTPPGQPLDLAPVLVLVRSRARLCHLVRSCATLCALVPPCAILSPPVRACATLCVLVPPCARLRPESQSNLKIPMFWRPMSPQVVAKVLQKAR